MMLVIADADTEIIVSVALQRIRQRVDYRRLDSTKPDVKTCYKDRRNKNCFVRFVGGTHRIGDTVVRMRRSFTNEVVPGDKI